jgi:hypothetical protein
MDAPHRYIGLLKMKPLLVPGEEDSAASIAPFIDRGHRAALRAFSRMETEIPDAKSAVLARQAQKFWSDQWAGQTLLPVGRTDQSKDMAAEAVLFFGTL